MPELHAWPRGGLWRHADFLRLWSAQTISQFGTQISQLAIPLAAILVLDASAFEVALLGTVEFLPFLLFALPAGVWVDRMRRKPILVAADVARAVLLVSIPIAYAFDALTIWQLYAVGFLVGVCTVFFDVAYHSYLPSLVDRSQLVDGNSKLEISRSGAQLAGPGFAGALVAAFTAPYAILADAVSFVGSAAFLWRIRRSEPLPESTEHPSMRRELLEGIRFLLGHPLLAADCCLCGNLELLLYSRFLDHPGLRGEGARHVARVDRRRAQPRQRRLAARRDRGNPDRRSTGHRQDACRLRPAVRPCHAARAARATVVPGSLPRGVARAPHPRRRRVQRDRHQLPAGGNALACWAG